MNLRLIVLTLLFLMNSSVNAEREFFTPQEDLEALSSKEVDENLPNVFIIGDSISIGYTPAVADILNGTANVRRPIDSQRVNCGDSDRGVRDLSKWLGDKKWDVIHFNFGLHDICYRNPEDEVNGRRDKVNGSVSVPIDQYKANLETIVRRLKATDATLIWASTTAVPAGEPGRYVGDEVLYNQVASKIMTEHDILVNDLYALSSDFDPVLSRGTGNVHYTKAGSLLLADQVATKIMEALRARDR